MPKLTHQELIAAAPFKHQVLAALRDGRKPFTSSGYGKRGSRFHWGDDDVYAKADESKNGWESDGRVAVPQGTPVFAPCDGYLQDIDHPWENESGGHVWLNVFTAPAPTDAVAARTRLNGWDPALGKWAREHSTGWKLGIWHMRVVFVRSHQTVVAGQILGIAGFDPRNNPNGADLMHTHKEVQQIGKGQAGSVDPAPHFKSAAVLPWTPIWPGMVHTPNGPLNPPWSLSEPCDHAFAERLGEYVHTIEGATAAMRTELKR